MRPTCARTVVVVVRLLPDGRDVDDTDPGGQRAGPQLGQGVALGAQHRKPLLEQPGMHLAVVIDRLTERREVADVRTSVVYEHIRRPVLEPLGTDIRT